MKPCNCCHCIDKLLIGQAQCPECGMKYNLADYAQHGCPSCETKKLWKKLGNDPEHKKQMKEIREDLIKKGIIKETT